MTACASYFQLSWLHYQILMEGMDAIGVSFVQESGTLHHVFADKEVIVSASAINSPHLLMLSGIGPKDELEKHGVSDCCHLL